MLECPTHHGLFIDRDSLSATLRDTTEDRPRFEEELAEKSQQSYSLKHLEENEAASPCPVCEKPMVKSVFGIQSGVAIDTCDQHGVWLDHGELQRLEAWYEAQKSHVSEDRKKWGGKQGMLEKIELEYETKAAEDIASVHWGPLRALIRRSAFQSMRRDD